MRIPSKLSRCFAAWMAIALGVALAATEARAVIVSIKYYDRAVVNPEFAGGPLWTGYVDTVADTLTIETWTELPLHGLDYWVPRQLPDVPLVWRAYTFGVVDATHPNELYHYDVPDTFDGNIDDTFAFVSDLDLSNMEWKRAVFQNNQFQHFENVEYTLESPLAQLFWPGWGGLAREEIVDGVRKKVFRTANPSTASGQSLFDEHTMPALPVKDLNAAHPHPVPSTGAEITVQILPPSAAVPEGRQWLTIPAALLVALAARWFAQRRRLTAVPVVVSDSAR